MISIISGNKTFVSYNSNDAKIHQLPKIKDGVLGVVSKYVESVELIHRANTIYAKDYMVWRDVEIVFKNLNKLG